MFNMQEAIEKEIVRVIGVIENEMEESQDDSDEEFEAVLDIIISNQGSELLDPIIAEICDRLGRKNPW